MSIENFIFCFIPFCSTRYSDDLTFSGDFKVREVISFVSKLLKKQGLELNYKKIHVVRHHQRQLVTGVLVNNKVSIPNFYNLLGTGGVYPLALAT